MLKEKNPFLKTKMKVENSSSINKFFEALYSLYDSILNESIEIFFFGFFQYSFKLLSIDSIYF